jgi:hypothetical protein
VGRLRKGGGGGAAPTPLLYDFGAPTGTGGDASAANVVAQWIFDETTGNIVDEVNSISLTPVNVGGIAYNLNRYYTYLPPGGVRYGPSASFFRNTSVNSVLSPGTGDWTVEAVGTFSGNNNGVLIDCRNPSDGKGWAVYILHGANRIAVEGIAEDGTAYAAQTSAISGFQNWELIYTKIRVVHDRTAGFAYIYYNGVLSGSLSIAAVAGKTINAYEVRLANNYLENRGGGYVGHMKELRVSLNATNNSGGPNGG